MNKNQILKELNNQLDIYYLISASEWLSADERNEYLEDIVDLLNQYFNA